MFYIVSNEKEESKERSRKILDFYMLLCYYVFVIL